MTGNKIATILILIPLLAITTSCAPKDVPFQSVARQMTVSGGTDSSAEIVLLTSAPATPIPIMSPADDARLRAIDYSRCWVLLVWFGFGAEDEDNVNSVSQQGNVVYVRAEFLPLPTGDVAGFPYEIVQIEKKRLVLSGTTTFKLMDQFGNEKANVTRLVVP